MLNRLFGQKQDRDRGRTGGAYTVRAQDAVRPLQGLPQSSVGAPLPCIVAGEHFLAVAYLCEQPDPAWDGSYVRVVSATSDEEAICVVRFEGAIAHFFGPPNDEAFAGHPLSDRGLKPYGAFEVASSSWIHALERMNSVHPRHNPSQFSNFKHFVLSFHDTTFECVARGYTVQMYRDSLQSVTSGLCASL